MKYKRTVRLPPLPLQPHPRPTHPQLLAGMWNDFVNAKKRMQSEGPFLLEHLPSHKKVFDAALGTGADSIFLLQNGYEVTGNEIDRYFRGVANANLLKAGLGMPITEYDWLTMDSDTKKGSFDAVICLGNSLTYISNRQDQGRVLANFIRILRPGGVLILDTRNYDYMLDESMAILNNGSFNYSGNYVYCGTNLVHAKPVAISDSEITMEYKHIRTKKKAYLYLYPFRRIELRGRLQQAGFADIKFFSDYEPRLDKYADFHQFVCMRPCLPTF